MSGHVFAFEVIKIWTTSILKLCHIYYASRVYLLLFTVFFDWDDISKSMDLIKMLWKYSFAIHRI